MPYHIEAADHGYFVVGPSGRKSKKPLSATMAKKQKVALDIAKARSHGHDIPQPMISMPASEFKAEHKRLVKTLEEGSRVKQMAEARRQAAELRERMG
jgi:hypothetical protein